MRDITAVLKSRDLTDQQVVTAEEARQEATSRAMFSDIS
jgi:hypothetical protein